MVRRLDSQLDLEPVARSPPGKRSDRHLHAQLVERGGSQVGDQAAEVRDLLLKSSNRLVDGGGKLVGAGPPTRRAEADQQPGEVLRCLIVQLSGPAPAFLLDGDPGVAGGGAGRARPCAPGSPQHRDRILPVRRVH